MTKMLARMLFTHEVWRLPYGTWSRSTLGRWRWCWRRHPRRCLVWSMVATSASFSDPSRSTAHRVEDSVFVAVETTVDPAL